MFSRQKLFFSLGAYWLVYMMVIRLVFLLYNYDLTAGLTFSEACLSLWKGLRMDLSITGYFLVIYGLVIFFSILFPLRVWEKIATGYTLLLLFFSGVILVTDEELYRHWGFRLNGTPFDYLGSGAFGSISPWVLVKGVSIFVLVSGCFGLIFARWIKGSLSCLSQPVPKWSGAVMLALTGFLILPIRGSLTVAPMNTGFVYFHSSKPYANHAAVNVLWNFMSSLRKSANVRYPEDFFDSTETARLMKELYADTLRAPRLLKIARPNILLIVLESFTSDLIAPLGGLDNITPNLSRLCREGVLFTHFYASGDRTDKGLVSILSGYPAQPRSSIVKFPGKTERLPSLTRVLEKQGYHTAFMYGGDADFANFRSYLTNVGFRNITEMSDFPTEVNTSKWGVHDQYLFKRLEAELDTARMPFFRTVLTLSSHEPFDVPVEKPFVPGTDEESLFLNSSAYTDHVLGDFFAYARRQPWWDSTLVVITADHGHRHPGNKKLEDERRFRIPLLLLGGALAATGREVPVTGSQTDIANTLLGQLMEPDTAFRFSRDLLSPGAASFAAFFYQNGYGFVQPDKLLVYDHDGKDFVRKEGAITEDDIARSKALQQALFSDYNRK
ncbi:MAG: hypothetical protein ABS46_04180 [Cytophagaceae bacterium SCN 52-12]|nr:MAG: hypothetical protein ABS46_04180 [Cytophagaceae bacterium SCN 52-12]